MHSRNQRPPQTGVSVLIVTGIITQEDILSAVRAGGGWVAKPEDRMSAQPAMEAGFVP